MTHILPITELAQTLIIMVTATTVVGGFLAYLFRKIRKGTKRLAHLGRRIDALADLANEQLTTNGGSSLLDKVNQIKVNHELAESHWAEAKESIDQLIEGFQLIKRRQQFYNLLINALVAAETQERKEQLIKLIAQLEKEVGLES